MRSSNKKTFDAASVEMLADTANKILIDHPEVRSVIGILDFYGNANNDSELNWGVWVSREGAVNTPDAIMGSLHKTLKMLEEQMNRAKMLIAAYQERLTVLGHDIRSKMSDNPKRGGS